MGTLLGLFSSGQAPRPRVAPERADSEVPLTPNVGQGYGRCIVRSTGEGVHGERQQRQRARQDLYPVASQPHLPFSLRPATSVRGYAPQGSERRQETHHSNCVFFQDFSADFREHVLYPRDPVNGYPQVPWTSGGVILWDVKVGPLRRGSVSCRQKRIGGSRRRCHAQKSSGSSASSCGGAGRS